MLESYFNILVVFALVLVGYFLSKKGLFEKDTMRIFSYLVLNIALPFNMFLNMTEKFNKEEFLSLFTGMLLPAVSILATFGFSIIYGKLTKVETSRKGLFQTMFTVSNSIFMGIPINLAIFGESSIPYVLLYYICNTTFFWTVGIYLISSDNQDPTIENVKLDVVGVIKLLLTPAMLGFIIGMVWMLLEIPEIPVLSRFANHLSGLTTPLSMFVIGMIIYHTGIKNLRMNKDTFGVLLGRYFFSPLMVILLSFIIHVPDLMLKVFIVQAAMPAQNTMPVLAKQYGADAEFATTTQAFTFLVYLFVIPILIFFVH
ncbi:AEC family transporter [Vagococcus coleopterorum]|uniref:AEC family transporter n=1 Tax=Vagococcus coleopterorum TaxID=2714946 RepID=A0A6G8ANA3_9ENTE|nr:AEC family transporter [Vagococcus coleopterorum]QIL46422.1 AEC family transporter [Vagococcus coleopterorum]